MSRRYCNSPVLRFRIGESRLRAALYAALCLAVATAHYLIFLRGYNGLALLLALPALILLGGLARDPAAGVWIAWRGGRWSLCRGGVWQDVIPHRRTVVTRWVICLVYSYAPWSARNYLWLYADSLPAGELRRLRLRLALQKPADRERSVR